MKFKFPKIEIKAKPISNLRDLVCSGAQIYGEKTLYLYKEKRETCLYSYARLLDEMNCIGTALAKMSLTKNGTAITGNAHPQWVASFLAVVNGGGHAVPLDAELSAEQTINFIERGEVEAVFYTSVQNEKIAEIAPSLKNVKLFVAIHPNEDFRFSDKVVTIDELIETGRKELEAGNTDFTKHPIDMEKMCAILFTSGTTGTSKGVMLSQKNFTAAINAAVLAVPFSEGSTALSVLPIHHAYELTCGHLAAISLGAELFINDSIKNIKRNVAEYKPMGLVVVPLFVETMYKRVVEEARKKGLEKKLNFALSISSKLLVFRIDIRRKLFGEITASFGGNLKAFVCGGAPLSPKLIKNFYALGIVVLEGYGITECAPLVSVNSPDKAKINSVGLPVQGCRVKIDKDTENADGKTGEILVKGDNVMMGYYKDPEATREAFTEDGWFKTGDFGYIDKAGFVFVTGRKKNIIILSNGKNVYPEELEEYLSDVELIEECVILERKKDGVPVIVAVAVPNEELTEGLTEKEIYVKIKAEIDRVNSALPAHKYIYDVEIRHENFERNTSKKILRHKVQ